MDIVEFVGHFDNVEFPVSLVDWDRYQVMDLYDDFQEKGSFYGIPKYFLLLYNLPKKPKARIPLESDDDFGKMRVSWEMSQPQIVHLYLKPLPKPSKPQLILESVAKLPKPQIQHGLTFSQPASPLGCEINFDLLTEQQVEPTEPRADPIKPTKPTGPTADPIKPTEPGADPIEPTSKPVDLPSPRRVMGIVRGRDGEINHAVPVEDNDMSLSEAHKWASELIVTQPDGSSQILFEKPKKAKKYDPTSSFRRPLTRDKKPTSSPKLKGIQSASSIPTQSSIPSSAKHKSQKKLTDSSILSSAKPKVQRKLIDSSIPSSAKPKAKKKPSPSLIPTSGGSSRLPRFTPSFSANPKHKTISLSALGLNDFAYYDIEEICQQPSKYTNEPDDDFVLEAELMVAAEKEAEKEEEKKDDDEAVEDDEGDEGDSDFSEGDCTSEEEDVNLEEENERRQQFGVETGDIDDEGIVVNKMAKVFKQGQMWKLGTDNKASLRFGDMFTTKEELVMVVKDVCIRGGFQLIKLKSSRSAYTQRCAHEGCTWRIHASHVVDGSTWMVKSIRGEHIESCGVLEENKMADPKWVATKLIDFFKMKKDASVEAMQDEIRKQFGIELKEHTCWRARRLMRAMVEGRHEEGYRYLPAYCEEFKTRNLASICLVNWINQGPDRPPVFSSLVISIGPACQSFVNHCRPLIGIDATHLKGPYRGVLLTALGLDANNGQFPLAYSVVEKENEETWTYFLRALTKSLDCVENQSRYTVISDRHWGIVNALKSVMPTARRRLCVFHYYKNFATQYPGAWFHSMFYMAANTHAEFVYRRVMELIKAKDRGAYDWLVLSEVPNLWARCTFDPNLKCEDNTNNFVESFNHAIVKFRGRPCLTMLEDLRKLIGRRFVKRSEMALKWKGVFVPFVDKKLKELTIMGRVAKITHMGDLKFDVEEAKDVNFTVHLKEKFCNCNKWQITGIPCKHATRCIINRKLQIQDFVEPCYTVDTYKKLYNHVISPIPSPMMWQPRDLPLLDPPYSQVRTGRPPLHKRQESTHVSSQIEGSATVRCTKCKQLGHNRTTCGRPKDDYGRSTQKRKRPPPPLDENGMRKKRGRRPKQPQSGTTTAIATQQSQTS